MSGPCDHVCNRCKAVDRESAFFFARRGSVTRGNYAFHRRVQRLADASPIADPDLLAGAQSFRTRCLLLIFIVILMLPILKVFGRFAPSTALQI